MIGGQPISPDYSPADSKGEAQVLVLRVWFIAAERRTEFSRGRQP